MSTTATHAAPDPRARPAWREPLVWMIVGIPAATVVAGLTTWWIAAQRADSNVAEDYYKRGLAINRSLEREARAEALGLQTQIDLRDGNDLTVRLTGGTGPLPESITVVLTHPVRAEQDRRLGMDRQADGSYRLRSPLVVAGTWGVAIEAQDWRVAASRVVLSDGASVRLGPDGRVR
jgi:hypothetical protein